MCIDSYMKHDKYCMALIFLQVVILVIMIIVVPSSIDLIVVSIYSKLFVDTKCADSGIQGNITLIVIATCNLLQWLSCFLFAYDALCLFTRGHCKKKIRFWLCILAAISIFSYVKLSTFYGKNIIHHLKECFEDDAFIVLLFISFIPFSDISMIVLCSCSMKIFYSSYCSWKKATTNMKVGEWRPGQEILCEIIEEKLNCLYYNYIKVGRKISLECNVLRQWFVVMYSQCFLLVLVSVLELMSKLSHQKASKISLDYLKFTAIFDILAYFLIFFLPYYMGMIVNRAHQNYHKKIIDTYFGIGIVVEGHKYSCIPGKPFTGEELALNADRDRHRLAVSINSPVQNEASPLLQQVHTETEIEVNTEEREKARRAKLADEKYKEYFKEALRAHKGLIMAKITEFDFIPSLIISFPLGSFLYTFTAISSLLSVIFIGYLKDSEHYSCQCNFTEVSY